MMGKQKLIERRLSLCVKQARNLAHSHSVNLANTIYQPIPSTIRQEIKAELSIGVPVNEVYMELREGMGNRESRVEDLSITRAHLISRAHVSDIKDA